MKRENEFVKGSLWLAHKSSSAYSDPRYMAAYQEQLERNERDRKKQNAASGAKANALHDIGRDAMRQGPPNSSMTSEEYRRAQQAANSNGSAKAIAAAPIGNPTNDKYQGAKMQGQQSGSSGSKSYESGKQRAMDSYIRSEAARLASEGNAARAKGGNAPKPPKYGTVPNQIWKAAYNRWYYYDRKDDPNNPWARQTMNRRNARLAKAPKMASPTRASMKDYIDAFTGNEGHKFQTSQRRNSTAAGKGSVNVTPAEYQAWKSRNTSGPSLRDKAKSLGSEIVNAGKNYLSNYADGAQQIKAYWKVGASEIADRGKKFIQNIFSK